MPAPTLYQIPAPELFSFKAADWEAWECRFRRFRSASGLSTKSETDQINSLIYLMGPQAEQVFASLKLSTVDASVFETVI